ncbi:MAG: hypothetical protein K2W96_01390 [Gemmataceae bacterium]|nr:hypothetical protein [Gemmataceae bacterium]
MPPDESRFLEYVQSYEDGEITLNHLIDELVGLGGEVGVLSGVVAQLPGKAGETLERKAATPPATPEGVLWVGGVCARISPQEWEAIQRREQERWFNGIWAWHRSFVGKHDRP